MLEEEIRKHSKSFWLTELFINHYLMVPAVLIAFYLLCFWITISQGLLKFNDPAFRDYFSVTSPYTQMYDVENKMNLDQIEEMKKYLTSDNSRLQSKRFLQELGGNPEQTGHFDLSYDKELTKNVVDSRFLTRDQILTDSLERKIPVSDYSVGLAFKCKDDCKTIMTVQNLRQIMDFENKITSMHQWSELCYDGSTGTCPDSAYKNATSYFSSQLRTPDSTLTNDLIQA